MANKPDKGLKGGSCNVTACQAPGANYMHTRMFNAYYCRHCAIAIARACVGDYGTLFSFIPDPFGEKNE